MARQKTTTYEFYSATQPTVYARSADQIVQIHLNGFRSTPTQESNSPANIKLSVPRSQVRALIAHLQSIQEPAS